MNAGEDKVIELHFIDWFSSLTKNQTFNVRPYLTEKSCLDSENQLKDFSVILEEVILDYCEVFPGTIFRVDSEATNLSKLSATAQNLAVFHYEELLKWQAEAGEGEPPPYTAGPVEAASGIPLPAPADLERGKDFSDRQEQLSASNLIWLGAYEKVFNFLGLFLRTSSDLRVQKPVSIAKDTVLPDTGSQVGELLIKYKKSMGYNVTTEIGLLDFYLPEWQAPTPKTVTTVLNPVLAGGTILPKMQGPGVNRAVNYNPSVETRTKMGDSLNSTGIPGTVQGYLQPGTDQDMARQMKTDRERTGASISGVAKPVSANNWWLSLYNLEKIVAGMRNISSTVISQTPITMQSDEFIDLPRVFIPGQALYAVQPTYVPGLLGDTTYLLYNPTETLLSVAPSPLAPQPPGGLVLRYLDTPLTAFGNSRPVINDPNISNFNVGFSNNEAFISLVPSEPTMLKLEALLSTLTEAAITEARVEAASPLASLTKFLSDPLGNLFMDPRTLERNTLHNPIYDHSVVASLGTGNSTTPHISEVLEVLIAGVNNLVAGEPDPFVVQQVDLVNLTEENFTDLFLPGGLFSDLPPGNPERVIIETHKPTVVLVGRSSFIKASFSNNLLARVTSFPEITRVEEDYDDYLFLSYGEEDSIITDLRFTGDIRVLYNLPQAFYASLQYNSLVNFFDTAEQEPIEKMLQELVVFVLEDRIKPRLKELKRLNPENGDMQDKSLFDEEQQLIKRLNLIQNIGGITYTSHHELLSDFPELITSYTDKQLAGVVGRDMVEAARTVASILGDELFAKELFPLQQRTFMGNATHPESLLYPRQLNVGYFKRSLETLRKSSADAQMNYINASQKELWTVEISTLGIPELDVMGAEFYARRIALNVNSPRGGTSRTGGNGSHWLTGVYGIMGIRHDLEPGSGFISTLTLLKLPDASLPIL
tara:strand:- start:924 stop:3722 length:2799 start_codon:yes stop_codon:yes gene_type:complete